MDRKKTFRQQLAELINKNCRENESDTPDFILAKYIDRSLQLFEQTLAEREAFCGRPSKLSDEKYQECSQTDL